MEVWSYRAGSSLRALLAVSTSSGWKSPPQGCPELDAQSILQGIWMERCVNERHTLSTTRRAGETWNHSSYSTCISSPNRTSKKGNLASMLFSKIDSGVCYMKKPKQTQKNIQKQQPEYQSPMLLISLRLDVLPCSNTNSFAFRQSMDWGSHWFLFFFFLHSLLCKLPKKQNIHNY